MKPTIVFATNNQHKANEIRAMLSDLYEIKTLSDIGCTADIPETADTLEGNALIKARYVKEHFGLDCFADDSGLEVEALDNAPGVYSARYAGEANDSNANMDKLLTNLEGVSNRKARFRTVIALIRDGREYLLEGAVEGSIRNEKCGHDGFGYDPIFEPAGYDITFAEMSKEQKNSISHRGQAVAGLIELLRSI